jgi:YoaP-like
MNNVEIRETTADNILEYGTCGYKNIKIEGYQKKVEWLKEQYKNGLQHKILHSEKDGNVGGIEYTPGRYAWRPVEADGYLFVHCIYLMKKEYKDHEYGVLLIEDCINDAQKGGYHGVAVIVRKGTWMAGREVFAKCGFETIAKAKPDYELMVFKLDKNAPLPKFKESMEAGREKYADDLNIIYSAQCPYVLKTVPEITAVAEDEFSLKPKVVELKTHKDAQNAPCVFATNCIMSRGKILAERPVSKGSFRNLVNKKIVK